MPYRVLALAVLALITGLWVGGPSPSVAAEPTPTPSAEPSRPAPTEDPGPTEEPSPEPSCVVGGLPGVVCPSASTTPSASPSPSAKPRKTAEPSPTRSRRPRSTPRPAATSDEVAEPTGPAVTSTIGVGAIGGATAAPATTKAAGSAGDRLDQIFGLVLLSAVALGFAGVTGLYVTRHRPLH